MANNGNRFGLGGLFEGIGTAIQNPFMQTLLSFGLPGPWNRVLLPFAASLTHQQESEEAERLNLEQWQLGQEALRGLGSAAMGGYNAYAPNYPESAVSMQTRPGVLGPGDPRSPNRGQVGSWAGGASLAGGSAGDSTAGAQGVGPKHTRTPIPEQSYAGIPELSNYLMSQWQGLPGSVESRYGDLYQGMDTQHAQRYGDVMNPYSAGQEALMSGFGNLAGDMTSDYGARTEQGLGYLRNASQQSRQDIEDRYSAMGGARQADLAQRGLAGTTLSGAARTATEKEKSADLRRHDEAVRREFLDAYSGLSGQALAAEERLRGAGLGAAQRGQEFAAGLSGDLTGHHLDALQRIGELGAQNWQSGATGALGAQAGLGMLPHQWSADLTKMNLDWLTQLTHEGPSGSQYDPWYRGQSLWAQEQAADDAERAAERGMWGSAATGLFSLGTGLGTAALMRPSGDGGEAGDPASVTPGNVDPVVGFDPSAVGGGGGAGAGKYSQGAGRYQKPFNPWYNPWSYGGWKSLGGRR